jgi:deoxyribodipyrimidine photo-lyase
MHFPTKYDEILARIEQVDPIQYGETRNYLDGAVTYLSPYIARGVISTKMVLEAVLDKGYQLDKIESFVKELAWRDYFQRIGQVRNLETEIKFPQTEVENHEIPIAVVTAKTGIQAIDQAIEQLYSYGYMHNHLRMYTAAIVTNIGKSHWFIPSKWMYYHLLDGDFASNRCSWQWVCGANSNKKYVANQENINRFAGTQQHRTFLDHPYESLPPKKVPAELIETTDFTLETKLPITEKIQVDASLPTFVYTYYNLDPMWHLEEAGNRILLLDPFFFKEHPISSNVLNFALELAKNIENIQFFVGSFSELKETYSLSEMYFKEHPMNHGYSGIEEPRDWISTEITGYFPSFFSYWKALNKELTQKQALP